MSHIDDLLRERDVRQQQRFDAQTIALADARNAAKEAVEKAEDGVNERLALLNELRHGVATSDQLEAVRTALDTIESRVQTLEDTKKAGQQQIVRQIAIITAAVAVIGMIVLFANGVF
jgi:tetrahydromethanopterin S-methyltransferase subunit G